MNILFKPVEVSQEENDATLNDADNRVNYAWQLLHEGMALLSQEDKPNSEARIAHLELELAFEKFAAYLGGQGYLRDFE